MGRNSGSVRGNGGGSGNGNRAATEWYTSGDGMWINQYLRGRGDFGELSASEKVMLKSLDSATQGRVNTDTLYRSVDASAVFGEMTSIEYDNLVEAVVYHGNNRYANSAKSKAESAVGKTMTEKGFMSTTKSARVAHEWGGFTGSNKPVVMEIKTGGKAHGADISRGNDQKEVILKRGTRYKITGIGSKDGNIVVKARLI